ncbi:MAG TPA: D-glycero-beta-D-manno-heptose 1,7-bisphosphate 7-phosphatase [Myxococcota bacterium]|nr:D-glycero-beta-D-manno-heptose 1,7-bisphosphate 7-phosphatase [Myxococcota bacterium]
MRPFVFLDRDGTLVADRGYTHRVEDYALLPGVPEALRRLARAGFALAVVTNQSGIGRGYYGEDDFHAFQRHLAADLARQGVVLEASFFCPHLPEAGCACRKPAPGMLERARRELGADLARSWVIGDHRSDVELAARAGCAGAVLVLTGHGPQESAALPAATPRAPDLAAAAELVVRGREGAQGTP